MDTQFYESVMRKGSALIPQELMVNYFQKSAFSQYRLCRGVNRSIYLFTEENWKPFEKVLHSLPIKKEERNMKEL